MARDGVEDGTDQARVTIRDVARVAGVSKSTVSSVIRGGAGVAPSTADRVRAAMARMNYVYDPRAVRFRAPRAGPLGVAVRAGSDPIVAGILAGISAEAEEAGQGVLVSLTRPGAAEPARLLRDEGAAGLLIDGRDGEAGLADPARDAAGGPGAPFLSLFLRRGSGAVATIDGAQALRIAGRHLAALGAERVALAGASHLFDGHGADLERLETSRAGEVLRALGPQVGIVAGDPVLARALRAAGRHVVAFGEADPGTVALRIDAEGLGRRIARALLDRIAGRTEALADLLAPVWLEGAPR